MSRKRPPRPVLSLALGAGLAVVVAASSALAKDPEVLRLRAFAVDLNNGARTNTVDIVIERWSTPEEASNLKAVFTESGGDKLLSALQKVKPRCGFVRTSTSLGWDLYYARETDLPDGGKKIILATDRPVSTWEARNQGRSMDYQFSLAEIRMPATGKGSGKAIPAAKLTLDKKEGTLEIENYQREPVRLNEITVVESRSPGKTAGSSKLSCPATSYPLQGHLARRGARGGPCPILRLPKPVSRPSS